MYGCESWDYKESWVLKNWCFWTVVLEKTLENPLDYRIKPVNPKGNQSWIFIGRTDAEAETPILWPSDVKNWFTGKDPDAGKDWRQEEKGTTEDEMVGWHHRLGHKFEQAPGVGGGQGSLACCSPWGRKKSDTTEQLNWTEIPPSNIPSCSQGSEDALLSPGLNTSLFPLAGTPFLTLHGEYTHRHTPLPSSPSGTNVSFSFTELKGHSFQEALLHLL